MNDYIDLHIHTTVSDGLDSAEKIFKLAKRSNLSAISITDHDTLNNIVLLDELSNAYGVDYVTGVEISSYYLNKELHILAYDFDTNHYEFSEMVSSINNSRLIRAKQIINNLNEKYRFELDFEDLKTKYNYYGRPQIARLLVKKKICKSVQQAFIEYLSNSNSVIVPKMKIDVRDVIEKIQNAGGKSFIAHFSKYEDWNMLNKLVEYGLDGIEVFHPSHKKPFISSLLTFCEENKLLVSGGSDYHGDKRVKNKLGNLKLNKMYLDQIVNKL